MSRGIDITKHEPYVIDGMERAIFEEDLAKYYEVTAYCLAATGTGKAFEIVDKLGELLIPEKSSFSAKKRDQIMEEVEGLDKWYLELDLGSVPRHYLTKNHFKL